MSAPDSSRPAPDEPLGSRDYVFLIGLWVVAFALRWLWAHGDFDGDEAWYLYLSHGFGSEPAAQADHPWFHILNRPLFYALYHPSTYAGLFGFRVMGTVISACVPALSFLAARRFGAGFLPSAFTASCLGMHAIQLRYSALVFPDALAAAFALAACWAVAARASLLAQALALCSVGSKESFIIVPLMVALLDLSLRRERGESLRASGAQWALLIVPYVYLAAVTLLVLTDPTLSMQGWAKGGFTMKEARRMWVAWEMWPLIAWLVWRCEGRALVLWLGLPVFYLLWIHALSRGIAPWYAVGPSALSSVGVAQALQRVSDECQLRIRRRSLQYAVLGLCASVFLWTPYYGLYKIREQWLALDGHFPEPDPARAVVAAIERRKPDDVLLVNCFWAYRYSHLRGSKPATTVHWGGAQDTEHVLESARNAPLTVACRASGNEQPLRDQLKRESLEVLYEDPRYLVLAHAQ